MSSIIIVLGFTLPETNDSRLKINSLEDQFCFGIRPIFGCDIVGFRDYDVQVRDKPLIILLHQPVMFNRSDLDLNHCVFFCQKKVPLGPSLKQTTTQIT